MNIESVEIFACGLPFRGRFKIAGGTVGQTGDLVPHIFVRIRDSEGLVGWGEARPSRYWSYETEETVTTTLQKYLAPAILGQEATGIAAIENILNREIAGSVTIGQPIAKSAINTALYDLLGHRQQQSLRRHLSPTPANHITLSWTVTGASLPEVEQSVADGLQAGYRNFNFKLGLERSLDRELPSLLRRRLPEAFLWADANQAYDLETAVAMSRELADAGVEVFEQPLKAGNLVDLRELQRRSGVPIAVDEPIVDPEFLQTLIRLEALDIFVLKVTRSGGIGPSLRMMELARQAGLKILGSGLTESKLGLTACAQLLAAYGITAPAALNGPQFLADDVVAEGVTIQGDRVELSDGPGLGITIDPQKIFHYQRADLRVTLNTD
jgi:L-alanine-DL-glutamate epimerase-like enolase superfamily enzyme